MRVLTYPNAAGDSSKDVAQARKGRSVALLPALPLGLWGPQLPGWEAGCVVGGRLQPRSDVLGQRDYSVRSSL